jgi:hypothetical protein
MGECILYGNGGSNPLNFKVICNPQPNTAKENTIWVDTDKINKYYFSATQPDNMVEYDVWFLTGTLGAISFNSLKKNGIEVYPISAKQKIDGVLVDKTAKIYRNGVWEGWFKYLFPSELEYNTYKSSNGTVSVADEVITFSHSKESYSNALFTFVEPIDVTQYSVLRVFCNITYRGTVADCSHVAICTTKPSNYCQNGQLPNVIAEAIAPNEAGIHELSISLSDVANGVYLVFYNVSNKCAFWDIRLG